MPEDMPEDMSDRMPEDMSEYMPEDMPEDMPDRMPNRMSEDMSDRMPEDLPVRKCINVMVGITRSKVIIFYIMKSLWLASQLLTGEAQKASLMHSDGSISILGTAILPFPATTRPFEIHYITTLDATSPCNDIFNISPCVMIVPL